MRIISTVPSQTELLSYLGLDEQIVGITKFCIHPEHIYRSKERVGGTKQLNIERIKALKPNLIIANKEENVKEQIEELESTCEVYVSDVKGLDSALEMIIELGKRTKTTEKAELLSTEIKQAFEKINPVSQKSCLYLIWQKPYMAVGNDTYIHDMLLRCGLQSLTGRVTRYPEVAAGEYNPELILLSSEPFPFKDKHIASIQAQWPDAKVQLVDGEYFSWYGPRMLGAADYFKTLVADFA